MRSEKPSQNLTIEIARSFQKSHARICYCQGLHFVFQRLMVRRSERINKGKQPLRYNSFEMASGDESEENGSLDNTIQENQNNKEMNAAMENMKLQMQQLMQSLELEKKERQRLSALLEQRPEIASSSQQVSSIPTTQHVVTSSTTTSMNLISPQTSVFSTLDPRSSSFEMPPLQNITTPQNPVPSTSIQFSSPSSSCHSQVYQPPAFLPPGINNLPFVQSPPTWDLSTGAVRKIVDLPRFGGKVEEWPAFNTAFEQSTVRYSYSNWENHLRLTRALFGDAKEGVNALLIHPENVGNVMIELKRMFGQSEQLLRSQLEKARSIAAIPENRLDLMIPFGTKVRNLAAFLPQI